MPKPALYRSGSVIYFQGDPAEKIYILQTGKINLVYQDMETGADIRDHVQPGEFFGVKSALGRYAREENAVAMTDTSVMVFSVPEFEAVVSANTRIIMKMLKVFSNQMRRVHKQVSKVMAKEEKAPADGLFHVGEFYFKNKRFAHAIHVFSRYLEIYPTGRNAAEAARNLEIAETSLGRFDDGKGSGGARIAAHSAAHNASGGNEKNYSDALNLVSHGKYQEAMMMFKKIVDSGTDADLTAKSAFEIGRCMFLIEKYEECIRYYTSMLTKYPKHSDLKETMYIIGQCDERLGKQDQAIAFYKKILSLGGSGDDSTIIKTKRALSLIDAKGA